MSDSMTPSGRAGRVVLTALLLALVADNLVTLGRVPASIHEDDGAVAAMAHTMWKTGRPGWPGIPGVSGIDADNWGAGRLGAAFQGIGMHVGGVSVRNALWPTFIAGLLLLGATFALAKNLFRNADAALLATVLLAASGKFFLASHGMRPDLLVAAMFAGSMALVVRMPRTASPSGMVFAGLLVGLSMDVHVNGLLLSPIPLLMWWILKRPLGREGIKPATAYSVGVAIALAYWIFSHYALAPEAVATQFEVVGKGSHGFKLARLGLFGSFAAELRRYHTWFWGSRGHRHLLEGVAVLASLGWAAFRGGRAGRALVAGVVAVFLTSMLFMSNSWGWYLIYVWPLFAIAMAAGILAVRSIKIRIGIAGLILLAYVINLGLWHAKAFQDVPLQARVDEIRRLVPSDVAVLADGTYWFAFWDREFTDTAYLGLRRLEVEAFPSTGPTGWGVEARRRKWKYVVTGRSGHAFAALDVATPLGEILASSSSDVRANLSEARRFAEQQTRVLERLPGGENETLILTVIGGADEVQGSR